MPNRTTIFASGCYYHIYNRGLGKGLIFSAPDNYLYLLKLIKKYLPKFQLSIIAYCLMPNHYHFLIRQDSDLSISAFISTLFNAYTQAYNREQARKGPLFESRFKHRWVDEEPYLVHLCRYIHLNPVNARLVETPDEWPYSNYLECIGLRNGSLKDETFIREWWKMGEYKQFVMDYDDERRKQAFIEKYLFE